MSPIKRDLGHSCTYAANVSFTSLSTAGVQDRLRHLENLVRSYMNHNGGAPLPTGEISSPHYHDAETPPGVSDVGSLKSSGSEMKYQDQTHWHSIMDAIVDLKEGFGEVEEPRHPEAAIELPSIPSAPLDSPLLYGCKRCSKEEILAAVPPKDFADRLISESFELLDLKSCAIHKTEFLKQYASFWEDPQGAPVMWLALLFSMLSIAVNMQSSESEPLRYGTQPDYGTLSVTYREKTVQCLILGQYTRCGTFVIETLIHHFAAEYTSRRDINNEAWLILGTTVHLAMRMGYHKDPSHFKSISPYNIVTSGQLGVPRLINDTFVDTAEPRNLLDSDLSPNMTELPPSRPETEVTPILIVLSRLRTGRVYAAVADAVTSSQPSTYAQILQVDRQIEDMFSQVPAYCRFAPQPGTLPEPGPVLLNRLSIQMSYHKALIILHWRFMSLAKTDDRYSYSTKTTVAAALKLLQLHHEINEGLQTGGRFFSMKWKLSSFFNHDLLMAMSILCFYIRQNGDNMSTHELKSVKEALRQAGGLWRYRPSITDELKRAIAAIEADLPDVFDINTEEGYQEGHVRPPTENTGLETSSSSQDAYSGPTMPFFGTMFEGPPILQGAPIFPSRIDDMGAFIDSVLGGSGEPWADAAINMQYPVRFEY
ncbi:hypothetical protein GGS20DRAFT_585281 [Poronia punctata]|nr:hypothetical protein GGS20DRAFT_585281 [Poronia punctata]